MAIGFRFWSVGLLLLATVFPTGVIAGEPLFGRVLFERDWNYNDRVEKLAEVDLKQFAEQLRARSRVFPAGFSAIQRRGLENRQLQAAIPSDGLGPMHNATSCAACHPGGGAAGVKHNVTLITVDPRSPFFQLPVKRLARTFSGQAVMDFFPGLVSGSTISFNTVVHDRSTRPGYDAIRERLAEHVPGGLQPEWFDPAQREVEAIAKRPVVAGRFETIDYYLSQRNTPALHGIGLIERISPVRMQAIADSQAHHSGGVITGRVAGKFGWRGQVSTLSQFVAGACAGELGLNLGTTGTQSNDPADPSYFSPAPDMSADHFAQLTSFVSGLPTPVEQSLTLKERKYVRSGEKLFNAVGCAACHMADLRPVSGIFSDLLLHDMGPRLQAPFPAPVGQLASAGFIDPVNLDDTPFVSVPVAPAYYGSVSQSRPPRPIAMDYPEQPQFPRGPVNEASLQGRNRFSWDALQREWKTPPLWGVADTAPYLHDGRAKTLTDAIHWHGGESELSKRKFESLNGEQQEKLLAFLGSLKAPQE